MWKEFLIVGMGSFLGGGSRFLVSKVLTALCATAFPLGTFMVNVVGCLLIGFFSGLNYGGGWMSPQAKLVLTTGFCGGFTTFSTFMNENSTLLRDGHLAVAALYLVGSVLLGFAAVVAGHQLAKAVA